MTTAAQSLLPAASTPRATVAARLRSRASHLGPLPVVNLVVLEGGLALGLTRQGWWWAVLLIAVPLAVGRWQGYWLVHWVQFAGRYLLRSHSRSVAGVPAQGTSSAPQPAGGGGDPRLALLRLLLPDLSVTDGTDQQREPLGLAWHQGTWTAVLEVDTTSSIITSVGASPRLPLGALAPCLEHRGVLLDTIQVIWHCYPGSTALPASSRALRSYLEVVGPLPASARRTTWVAVRLDPRRCPAAVAERGGGVLGCHRALISALSRVRSALEARGISTQPLDADALVRAGICAAELSATAATRGPVTLREGWTAVTAAGVGHASYVISNWDPVPNLGALASVRALSATVALSLSPGEEGSEVGLRGLVRLSARNPGELAAAQQRLQAASPGLGVVLRPLHGRQVAGLAATLPLAAPG